MATDVLRIAAIGDSLIYGRLDPIYGGWIGRLRKTVEEHRRTTSAFFNLGIGGETSADVLRRVAVELRPREPNVVIVGVGTNDLRRADSLDGVPAVHVDVYASNLDEIATICKTLGSRVILTGPIAIDENRTLPHENGYYYLNRDVRAYGARAREVADDHGAYLDLTPALADEDGETLALRDPTLLVDGMHPGTAGHARIFEVAKQALASLLPFDFPGD